MSAQQLMESLRETLHSRGIQTLVVITLSNKEVQSFYQAVEPAEYPYSGHSAGSYSAFHSHCKSTENMVCQPTMSLLTARAHKGKGSC